MPKVTKAAKKSGHVERKVLYPEVKVVMHLGNKPITVSHAKELMGWTEDAKVAKTFGCQEPLLTDTNGVKVWATNNTTNRPLGMASVEALKQEILNKRWVFNGEPIIVGKTGLILNGQHTLAALILADQVRQGKQALHWEKHWPSECTMDKVIVYGISEDDNTVNTMDTCRPRSLAEVIFRSEFFAKMKHDARLQASRMADHAIRLLWHHTGQSQDAFAPRRTHSEALDFISRHSRLLQAIRHVVDENADGGIARFISPGYAAGLLYLMGTSTSDGDDYRNTEDNPEKCLKFDNWQKALDFFTALSTICKAKGEIDPMAKTIYHTTRPGASEDDLTGAIFGTGEGSGSRTERVAVLVKAWLMYVNDVKVKPSGLMLNYKKADEEEEGWGYLDENPSVGGIDLGVKPDWSPEKEKADDDGETPAGSGGKAQPPKGSATLTADEKAAALERKQRQEAILANRQARAGTGKNGSKAGATTEEMEEEETVEA